MSVDKWSHSFYPTSNCCVGAILWGGDRRGQNTCVIAITAAPYPNHTPVFPWGTSPPSPIASTAKIMSPTKHDTCLQIVSTHTCCRTMMLACNRLQIITCARIVINPHIDPQINTCIHWNYGACMHSDFRTCTYQKFHTCMYQGSNTRMYLYYAIPTPFASTEKDIKHTEHDLVVELPYSMHMLRR